MQSTTLGTAKACIIPTCKDQKFHLVHKFPSDKERFTEWVEAVQKPQKIPQFEGLSDEQIRKRYFICCRHFAMNQYKNVESRSLNITAVPHLNLENMDRLEESKAWQTDDRLVDVSKNDDETARSIVSVIPSPVTPVKKVVRILNSEAVLKDNTPKKVLKIVKKSQQKIQKPVQITSNENRDEPEAKKIKILNDSLIPMPNVETIQLEKILREDNIEKVTNLTENEVILVKNEVKLSENNLENSKSPKKSSPRLKTTTLKKKESPKLKKIEQKIKVSPKKPTEPEQIQEEPTPPANKLLALIEVTPEQYEKLGKALTSAERSDQISSILNFIDKTDTEPESADNELSVEINEEIRKFDHFWLRDHCRCDNCYDHSNHQRKISVLDIPDDIKASTVNVDEEKLKVIWSDKHQSTYDLDFLIKNQPGVAINPPKITLWDNEVIENPLKTNCRVSMRDYMTDPDVSKKVLENLHVYGIAFIDGVQPTERNTEFVIRELFPVHKTLFGEMWTFSDAKDHSDTAYTNIYLGPHNDNTYFNDAAGLQILHCIQHSGTGGENFLIDGFQVARRIKENHPEVFERLTTTKVMAEYIEDGRHHLHSAPIISLDAITGEVCQIRFNLYDRAPLKNIPANKIREFYSDLKILAREFENVENRVTFKLQPGTVMIFDNWRVLHGRLAYSGKRTMTGCYVARTEYQSALRVNKFID